MVKKATRKNNSIEYQGSIRLINKQLKYGEQVLNRKLFQDNQGDLNLSTENQRSQITESINKLKELKEELIVSSRTAELKNVKNSFDLVLKSFTSDSIKKIAESYADKKVEDTLKNLKELKIILKN
jgi:hypothetical protein